MDKTRSVQLVGDERAAFLGTGGTGVASFPTGADTAPYAFPVSYGYDPVEGVFYLRLAFGPEMRGGESVGHGSPVTLVIHGEDESGWRSVIATGELQESSPEIIDSSVMEAMRRIHIPLVDVFERHPRELDFEFFRLSADEVTGRKEARSAD